MPSGPVQGDGQLAPEPLAEWMRDDEPFQLADDLAFSPEREPAFDELLERTEAQFLETDGFGAGPVEVAEALERAAPPRCERVLQDLDPLFESRSLGRGRGHCHEHHRVDDAVVGAERVARRPRRDRRLGREQPAEAARRDSAGWRPPTAAGRRPRARR